MPPMDTRHAAGTYASKVLESANANRRHPAEKTHMPTALVHFAPLTSIRGPHIIPPRGTQKAPAVYTAFSRNACASHPDSPSSQSSAYVPSLRSAMLSEDHPNMMPVAVRTSTHESMTSAHRLVGRNMAIPADAVQAAWL